MSRLVSADVSKKTVAATPAAEFALPPAVHGTLHDFPPIVMFASSFAKTIHDRQAPQALELYW